MKLKSAVLSAAGAIALLGGTVLASAGTASAATPPCGKTCIDLFSTEFGSYTGPNFVLDVYKQRAVTGQPLILWKASQDDPAEDFQASEQGLVSDFYAAGLVSAQVALHYGGLGHYVDPKTGKTVQYPDDVALESEYTPFGVSSGLCAGVGSTAAPGIQVTLQPCGVSPKTVWILDNGLGDPNAADKSKFADGTPLINGSDTNFSHPFVATYAADGYPTDSPRPSITTQNLTGFTGTNGVPVLGSVSDHQLWEAVEGVLP